MPKYDMYVKQELDTSGLLELGMDCSESPEMWETKVFAPPSWMKGLTQDDINAMYQLGALSKNGLLTEIKKIFDQAYNIGLQEAKEFTKGKNLEIFSTITRRK
ncbi:protein lin-52 homolog isoform X2 [Anopheles nili]|uniref:protein lin-52 homolog isoform X2 n=1 Tax=Anopheles nili TaxID=185578 RepID=UPI00237A6CFB|nr:protein lin-52 homolog isoform X2 [Anopheles nili]